MLKVLELFAGIGACSKALERLGIEHEIVDAVEIDKYAIKSFNAVHGTNFEPQDITKWDKDIQVDLIMHGSPCQDFSVAGKQAGGDKDSGTRSSLMYETLRIVEKLKPKYVIWENVKNLLSKKHRHNFDAYLEAMSKLGYVSKYQVLNAKDYGIPQNRERVFTVSIRDDHKDTVLGRIEDLCFEFPPKQELGIRLKDILEAEVDEKYYLSDEQTKRLKMNKNIDVAKTVRTGGRGSVDRHSWDIVAEPKIVARTDTHQKGGVYSSESVSPTITATTYKQPTQIAEPKIVASRGRGNPPQQHLEPRKDGLTNTITSVEKDNYVADPSSAIVEDFYKSREPRFYAENAPTLRADRQGLKVAIRTANKKGYDMAQDGDSVDLAYPDSETRRGRVGHGVSKTVTTGDTMGVVVKNNLKTDLCNRLVKDGVVKGGEIVNHSYTTSEQRNTLDKYIESDNGVMPTLTTRPDCLGYATLPPDVRIRKLTPKECWRLMGFDDEDFEKAKAAGISNSQLYKQAGNSIVVNVLESILKGFEWKV